MTSSGNELSVAMEGGGGVVMDRGKGKAIEAVRAALEKVAAGRNDPAVVQGEMERALEALRVWEAEASS